MNVLLIGRDSSWFQHQGVIGDTLARHARYAAALRDRCGTGSSLRIVTSAPPRTPPTPLVFDDGLSVYPAPHRHRVFYQSAARHALQRACAGWRPDLISSQTPFQDGLLALRVGKQHDAPVLVQLHLNFFAAAWRRESLLSRARTLLGAYVLRRADRVRVVSAPLKSALIAQLRRRPNDVHVVPVGMTEPSAYPLTQADAQQHLAPRFVGHPVVLFVGRFAPEKNLTRWIDVAKQIYARDANVRFVLVGDGPQRPEIERLVRTYGLEDVIALSGALPYSELPAAYAAADVFLLTSNHEGFGRVLIEAAFAGVPVVATRCGGPEGVIVDGETGYLRDTDDVSGLTEAVWSLLSDRGRANRVAAAARGRARSIFGLQSVVDALIECWQVTAERADRCVDIEEHSHKVPGSSSEVSCGSP